MVELRISAFVTHVTYIRLLTLLHLQEKQLFTFSFTQDMNPSLLSEGPALYPPHHPPNVGFFYIHYIIWRVGSENCLLGNI